MLKVRKRAFPFVLAFSLLVGLATAMPLAARAVDIAIPNLIAGANLSGTQVYFGSYGSSPILWHVVDTGSGTATLWTTTSMGNMSYDTTHGGGTH